jgi:hypothetical protein
MRWQMAILVPSSSPCLVIRKTGVKRWRRRSVCANGVPAADICATICAAAVIWWPPIHFWSSLANRTRSSRSQSATPVPICDGESADTTCPNSRYSPPSKRVYTLSAIFFPQTQIRDAPLWLILHTFIKAVRVTLFSLQQSSSLQQSPSLQ